MAIVLPSPATGLTAAGSGALYARQGSSWEPVGAGGPVFEEDWAGTNGDPWSGDWTTEVSGGSTLDIQSGEGRILLSSAGGYTAWGRGVLDDIIPADALIEAAVDLNGTTEQYVSLHFRGDADWGGTNDQMVDGWRVMWSQGSTQGWWLYKRVAGVETTMHGPVSVATNDTTQHVTISLDSSDIRVKIWTGAEPGPWSTEESDAALASQTRLAMSVNGGAAGDVGRNVTWHPITVT